MLSSIIFGVIVIMATFLQRISVITAVAARIFSHNRNPSFTFTFATVENSDS